MSMRQRTPIQIGSDTWIIMRETMQYPKAVVHRVTSTMGDPRYLLMTWEPLAADRRLVSIHETLDAADRTVPWAGPPPSPPAPGRSDEEADAYRRHNERLEAQTQRRWGKSRMPVPPVPPAEAWE